MKYSLVMTPCRVAECIISVRPRIHAFIHSLTYLLTCTVGSVRIKPAISPKRLKIERKLQLTAYIKSYAAKMHDLGPLSEIQSQLEVLIILWQFFPDPDRDPERTPESG